MVDDHKFTAHVSDKDCTSYQHNPLCSKALPTLHYNLNVGTFKSLFRSSTFGSANTHVRTHRGYMYV